MLTRTNAIRRRAPVATVPPHPLFLIPSPSSLYLKRNVVTLEDARSRPDIVYRSVGLIPAADASALPPPPRASSPAPESIVHMFGVKLMSIAVFDIDLRTLWRLGRCLLLGTGGHLDWDSDSDSDCADTVVYPPLGPVGPFLDWPTPGHQQFGSMKRRRLPKGDIDKLCVRRPLPPPRGGACSLTFAGGPGDDSEGVRVEGR
ncbi:hypothetical protein BXZ70DRAFT_909275 [Cristinia sonorae]|uniref:Uncharacterized protein n=1 Tax=Cristinia sonorae TaxID=1940300 RepID=A0A8K0UKR2_9AGAR|nr:hypothetical protein BXZ70DRAFT_909275 [Cristinia sonorae]